MYICHNPSSELFTFEAYIQHPTQKNYKPRVKYGCIKDTPFQKTLNLKEDARIMLTFNISVSDGLTNGTCGTIRKFKITL